MQHVWLHLNVNAAFEQCLKMTFSVNWLVKSIKYMVLFTAS